MATDAQKIEKYRAQANDKSIPQDVRNQYLDKANELEAKAAGYAKGGAVVKKKPIIEGKEKYASKAAMLKHEKKEPKKVEKKEEKMAKGGVSAFAKGGAVKPMAKKKC